MGEDLSYGGPGEDGHPVQELLRRLPGRPLPTAAQGSGRAQRYQGCRSVLQVICLS